MTDEPHPSDGRAAPEPDPSTAAVREALAATRADLAALADPPVPPAVAARWSAALAAESAGRGAAGPRRS